MSRSFYPVCRITCLYHIQLWWINSYLHLEASTNLPCTPYIQCDDYQLIVIRHPDYPWQCLQEVCCSLPTSTAKRHFRNIHYANEEECELFYILIFNQYFEIRVYLSAKPFNTYTHRRFARPTQLVHWIINAPSPYALFMKFYTCEDFPCGGKCLRFRMFSLTLYCITT